MYPLALYLSQFMETCQSPYCPLTSSWADMLTEEDTDWVPPVSLERDMDWIIWRLVSVLPLFLSSLQRQASGLNTRCKCVFRSHSSPSQETPSVVRIPQKCCSSMQSVFLGGFKLF